MKRILIALSSVLVILSIFGCAKREEIAAPPAEGAGETKTE